MGQITEIANKINPERLGKSANISDQSAVAKLSPAEQAKIDAELFDKNNSALAISIKAK